MVELGEFGVPPGSPGSPVPVNICAMTEVARTLHAKEKTGSRDWPPAEKNIRRELSPCSTEREIKRRGEPLWLILHLWPMWLVGYPG